jgi:hypothetical protein
MKKKDIQYAIDNVQKAVDRDFTGLKSVFLVDDCKLLISISKNYLNSQKRK